MKKRKGQGGHLQRKKLRLLEAECAETALSSLSMAFRRGCIYSGKDRLILREGCAGLDAALESAGFVREALDWVLWRN